MSDQFSNDDNNVTEEEWALIIGGESAEDHNSIPEKKPTSIDPVGYCKPPTHTQFKPGQSGNPMGRPRGRTRAESLRELRATIWNAAMTEVTTSIGGERQKISALAAVYLKLVEKALEGHAPSMRYVHELARETISEHEESQAELLKSGFRLIADVRKETDEDKRDEAMMILQQLIPLIGAPITDDDE